MAFSFNFGGATNTNEHIPPSLKPIEVNGAPDDSITSLNFSPKIVNQGGQSIIYFCASSWANDVRLWEMNMNTGQTTPKAQQFHKMPVLDTCWSSDGTKIYSACSDNTANCWDIGANTFKQIAAHDAPISTIICINVNGNDVVMTGGWDGKIRFWNCQQAAPIADINVGFKVYAADAAFPIIVVIGSNKGQAVISFETGQPVVKMKDYCNKDWPKKLVHQYSCVTVFKNKKNNYMPDGFAVGSVEGRVAITYLNSDQRKEIDPKRNANNLSTFEPNFAFKCHRFDNPAEAKIKVPNGSGFKEKPNYNVTDTYTVRFIKFHPEHQTLITAGSDGRYVFWDKDQRSKLGPSDKSKPEKKYQFALPLTAGDISPDGKFFIFATSYDWSYGHEYSNLAKNKPKIYIHKEPVNGTSELGTLVPKVK